MEANGANMAMRIVMEVGKTMIVSGAETYRVEDSIHRMLQGMGYTHSSHFVVPTCIIITIVENGRPVTYSERVIPGPIDLEKLDKANQLSRDISSGTITPEEALVQIETIEHTPSFPWYVHALGAGLAGGFFTLMFNGSMFSFGFSALGSILTVVILDKLGDINVNFFLKNILGGLFATLFGIIVAKGFPEQVEMGAVIVGPLMTLVPGVAFTNGIRDVISGELMSGSTKIIEAVFIAIGIAFGVGFALKLIA